MSQKLPADSNTDSREDISPSQRAADQNLQRAISVLYTLTGSVKKQVIGRDDVIDLTVFGQELEDCAQLLNSARKTATDGMSNSLVPFHTLVSELLPKMTRDASRARNAASSRAQGPGRARLLRSGFRAGSEPTVMR